MRRLATLLMSLATLAAAEPAHAGCDTNNLYSYNFNNATTATLAYGSNYNYTASNPLGATRGFNVALAANSMATTIATVGSNTYQLPRIDNTVISSSTGGKVLTLGGTLSSRTATITSTTRTLSATFTFSVPIRDFQMTVHDIDFGSNSFRDWIHISGSDGTTIYTPALSGPYGNNNSGTGTATNSSLLFGPYTSSTPNLSANEAVGVGSSTNTNSNTGNIDMSFAQPVTSITIRYGNYPLQSGETVTGQQFMGISQLNFCPMPSVSVAKTSTPYVTTGVNRFNTPGSDVSYALTVTNSGGSPVDLSTLNLTDTLPANVTFYNGDYDAASPGMGPFQLTAGSSGLTLPTGSASYSQNGSTYTYTPAAGYDPNVRYIKLTPTGSLAANSSVIIRFRAQIK